MLMLRWWHRLKGHPDWHVVPTLVPPVVACLRCGARFEDEEYVA